MLPLDLSQQYVDLLQRERQAELWEAGGYERPVQGACRRQLDSGHRAEKGPIPTDEFAPPSMPTGFARRVLLLVSAVFRLI